MPRYKKLLVVRANGNMRVASDTSRVRSGLAHDEVAYPLIVDMPPAWGSVLSAEEIMIKMPPPPDVTKGPRPK